MKTDVSIKYTNIIEYRNIENILEELGYVNRKDWNEMNCNNVKFNHVVIYDNSSFSVQTHRGVGITKTYNNLNEFLND